VIIGEFYKKISDYSHIYDATQAITKAKRKKKMASIEH